MSAIPYRYDAVAFNLLKATRAHALRIADRKENPATVVQVQKELKEKTDRLRAETKEILKMVEDSYVLLVASDTHLRVRGYMD